MKSVLVQPSLDVLWPVLAVHMVLMVLAVPVSSAPGCGPCDPTQCAALPAEGCSAGSVLDVCGCCSLCAAAEGEACGGRRSAGRSAGRRCGPGLECARDNHKSKTGVCVCKSNYQVCGTDGQNYKNPCSLNTAGMKARTEGTEPVQVRNKGRCPAAPVIVTAPAAVYNVSGSQVYLSCEAVGVPTPVLTWKKVLSGKKRTELLPGDRDNLAIQTRGGPEKHEVTGWVLISPLTAEEEGAYECHASNANGEATSVGQIHLVGNVDDVRTVVKDKL